ATGIRGFAPGCVTGRSREPSPPDRTRARMSGDRAHAVRRGGDGSERSRDIRGTDDDRHADPEPFHLFDLERWEVLLDDPRLDIVAGCERDHVAAYWNAERRRGAPAWLRVKTARSH